MKFLQALDHFPGFRVSFSMLVATSILFEIVLRRLRQVVKRACYLLELQMIHFDLFQTNVQNAVKMVISLTAFLISILLFYCVEFYQHMHDRVWDKEKEVGILIRIALIGYWVLVAVVTILNSIRAIKYVIFTK